MEIDPVVLKMKDAQAIFIPQGNHSLKAPKKSGLDNAELEEMILQGVLKFINK